MSFLYKKSTRLLFTSCLVIVISTIRCFANQISATEAIDTSKIITIFKTAIYLSKKLDSLNSKNASSLEKKKLQKEIEKYYDEKVNNKVLDQLTKYLKKNKDYKICMLFFELMASNKDFVDGEDLGYNLAIIYMYNPELIEETYKQCFLNIEGKKILDEYLIMIDGLLPERFPKYEQEKVIKAKQRFKVFWDSLGRS